MKRKICSNTYFPNYENEKRTKWRDRRVLLSKKLVPVEIPSDTGNCG